MEPQNPNKISFFMKGWLWLREVSVRLLAKLDEVARHTIKMVKDDPRRLIHSLKVGSSVTLVSLLYYFQALYSSFGVSAMWAVMTVVVVFEFSVGMFLFFLILRMILRLQNHNQCFRDIISMT